MSAGKLRNMLFAALRSSTRQMPKSASRRALHLQRHLINLSLRKLISLTEKFRDGFNAHPTRCELTDRRLKFFLGNLHALGRATHKDCNLALYLPVGELDHDLHYHAAHELFVNFADLAADDDFAVA